MIIVEFGQQRQRLEYPKDVISFNELLVLFRAGFRISFDLFEFDVFFLDEKLNSQSIVDLRRSKVQPRFRISIKSWKSSIPISSTENSTEKLVMEEFDNLSILTNTVRFRFCSSNEYRLAFQLHCNCPVSEITKSNRMTCRTIFSCLTFDSIELHRSNQSKQKVNEIYRYEENRQV